MGALEQIAVLLAHAALAMQCGADAWTLLLIEAALHRIHTADLPADVLVRACRLCEALALIAMARTAEVNCG